MLSFHGLEPSAKLGTVWYASVARFWRDPMLISGLNDRPPNVPLARSSLSLCSSFSVAAAFNFEILEVFVVDTRSASQEVES